MLKGYFLTFFSFFSPSSVVYGWISISLNSFWNTAKAIFIQISFIFEFICKLFALLSLWYFSIEIQREEQKTVKFICFYFSAFFDFSFLYWRNATFCWGVFDFHETILVRNLKENQNLTIENFLKLNFSIKNSIKLPITTSHFPPISCYSPL